MAEYKRLYTKEEIDDLLQWFAQRYDRLPERIALLDNGFRNAGNCPQTLRDGRDEL